MTERFATPTTEEEKDAPKTLTKRIRKFFWQHEMIEAFVYFVVGIAVILTIGGVYIASRTEIASVPFGFG